MISTGRIIKVATTAKQITGIRAPESISQPREAALQEAWTRCRQRQRTRPSWAQQQAAKSLSDMLKGKEGRFRRTLLGKRVGLFGKIGIVVGPKPQALHQWRLPREMRWNSQPFVMNDTCREEIHLQHQDGQAHDGPHEAEVWDALKSHQRASGYAQPRPDVHMLGIKAFEPILVDGKAIQLHPLVCHAFNADFDGDQMAVHVPLSRRRRRKQEF